MKFRVTYEDRERSEFERLKKAIIKATPEGRQHTSAAPGGLNVWYWSTKKPPGK